MMAPTAKYTFKDWYDGRIYFGGQTIVPTGEKNIFKNACKLVAYHEVKVSDANKIKRYQKKLHEGAAKKRLTELKTYFTQHIAKSKEPQTLIIGILEDLGLLFNSKLSIRENHILELKYIGRNIQFDDHEYIALKKYYHHQILRGKISYLHIQGPGQKLPYFANPPYETWVDAMYQFYKWFKIKYSGRLKDPVNTGTKNHNYGFALSKSYTTKFKLDYHVRISNCRLALRDPSYTFISRETTLPSFKRIFMAGEITDKVIWTGTVSELAFFINELGAAGIIDFDKQNKWRVTKASFLLERKSEQRLEISTGMLRHPGTKPTSVRANRLKSIVKEMTR